LIAPQSPSHYPGIRIRAGHAMDVAEGKRLTNEGARKMMATAIATAQQAGVAVSVAVADAGGHLILLERMEGGRFHSVHSATTKAVCAASNKRPTASYGAQAQALDVAHAIGLALAAGPERWTAMEGGYPIIVEGECIGGIGVSGGSWEIYDWSETISPSCQSGSSSRSARYSR